MTRWTVVTLAMAVGGCAASSRREPLEALNPMPAACPSAPATSTVVPGHRQEALFRPLRGFVVNAQTAIRIAQAVWEPIYGKDKIAAEAPYGATLSEGVWLVSGSLPPGWMGGVAQAEVCQIDGRVLGVSHGK